MISFEDIYKLNKLDEEYATLANTGNPIEQPMNPEDEDN
jgi:hypothetical protein